MLKKLIVLLIIFSSPVMAYQLLTEEQAIQQQRELAAYQVEQVKMAYFKGYEACIEQSKKHVLSANDFRSIQLNEQELKAVLLYFAAKNFEVCLGNIPQEYLMAMSVARHFKVPEYTQKDDPHADKLLARAASLAIDEVTYSPDYLAIAQSTREKLEKITALHNVFDLKLSLKALKAIKND